MNNAVTQASESFRKIDLEHYRSLRVEISCATVQGESHDFHQGTNKRDPMCFAHIEKLQEGDHNGKKSLIRWPIIIQFSLRNFLLEVLAIVFTLK